MSTVLHASPIERSLERALLFNLVIHAVAMFAMAAILLPALPGGGAHTDLERVAYIASSPWRFRAGWLPWHLCAFGDLWLAVAMVRARWVHRVGALFTLAMTVVAVWLDQSAQFAWVTRGVALAQEAMRTGSLEAYLAFERPVFLRTGAWAALMYTVATLGWVMGFAPARVWSRTLSVLSVPLVLVFGTVSVLPLLPPAMRGTPLAVALGNAVGFVLLEIWLFLLTERVLARARPLQSHGRLAPWRYPGRGPVGWVLDAMANSRVVGALLEPLPVPAMASEITDVVYVNYLLEADKLSRFVPPGLELQRLGPGGRWALFTFLTYHHGHFGFEFLGPLRRLMPSPIQTNWRIHVVDPRTGHRGIYFVTNAVTHTVPALSARLFTEGMPMHVFDRADVAREADGTLHVTLDPGRGSAPDVRATLSPCATPAMEGAWGECFASFREFLEYCVPQDRAMSSQPWVPRITRQEIALGITPDRCEPVSGTVVSEAAKGIAGDAKPVCFRVGNVRFRFSVEAYDSIP